METYEAPKMEVIRFENEDVITNSCSTGDCGCGGVDTVFAN